MGPVDRKQTEIQVKIGAASQLYKGVTLQSKTSNDTAR